MALLNTYDTRSEANRDYAILTKLAAALDTSHGSIRRDEYSAWCISAPNGTVYTWADGQEAWALHVSCISPRAWTFTKRKLQFLPVIQDCESEGCFKIDEIPSPEHGVLIREALGLRKKATRSEEARERGRAQILRLNSRQNRGDSAKILPLGHGEVPDALGH